MSRIPCCRRAVAEDAPRKKSVDIMVLGEVVGLILVELN